MSIVINQVSKNFGPVQALQNVSLTLEEGKIYGLLGRNGAGKSTLLNILTDRIFPNGGSVTLDREPVHNNDRALSKMYLMSEPSCYPDSMKVKDAFRWTKQFYPDFDMGFAWNLADAFELNVGAKVSKLSTGYTSIFKLIVALSVNTPYVLLDEPALGLDANHRELFYRLLLEKYTEKPFTCVISTHLIDELAAVVEDVTVLRRGQVLYSGSREALLSQGYAVEGKAEAVDRYRAGRPWIGEERLGGLKAAYFWGEPAPDTVPEGLELAPLDLQKLFIRLTEEEEEK